MLFPRHRERRKDTLSRRASSEACNKPLNKEGAGNAGCSATPAAPCAKVESTRVSHHRFAKTIRRFLRNGFDGLLRALSGDRLFCHRPRRNALSVVAVLTSASR